MGDKGLRLGLSSLRIAVIVAGILLSYLITSRSGSDETFVEGQERYGALLDGLFYIIYFVGIACAAAASTTICLRPVFCSLSMFVFSLTLFFFALGPPHTYYFPQSVFVCPHC